MADSPGRLAATFDRLTPRATHETFDTPQRFVTMGSSPLHTDTPSPQPRRREYSLPLFPRRLFGRPVSRLSQRWTLLMALAWRVDEKRKLAKRSTAGQHRLPLRKWAMGKSQSQKYAWDDPEPIWEEKVRTALGVNNGTTTCKPFGNVSHRFGSGSDRLTEQQPQGNRLLGELLASS
uniref:Uncharacterized protein n=1 Tax=Trichuris muris TaxID=70415 RepID=A0A5S6R331_TRIMR